MSTCTWTYDEDGNWRTECGNLHIFIDGTPEQNEYEFCPYCGVKIEELRFEADGMTRNDEVRA
jgi:hypothetical protein